MNIPENCQLGLVIAAGGSGSRAGGGLPKQFRHIGGKPVIVYSLETFAGLDFVSDIVVVVPENRIELTKGILESFSLKGIDDVVKGGPRRQDSVYNGLSTLEEYSGEDVFVVHDGARPFVDKDLIIRVVERGVETGSAVPALEVADSVVKKKGDRLVEHLDRTKLGFIQTPQVYHSDKLLEAYAKTGKDDFGDESSLMMNAGFEVSAVDGSSRNFKITDRADLQKADSMCDG